MKRTACARALAVTLCLAAGGDALLLARPAAARVDEDEVAPAIVSLATAGTALTLTFNERLGVAASLANGSFAVKRATLAGTEQTVRLTGSPSVSGPTVTLTLTAALAATDSVTVSYTRPTNGTGNRVVDASGNEALDFTYFARNPANAAACPDPTTTGRRELVRTVLTPADMLHHFTAPGYGYFARNARGGALDRGVRPRWADLPDPGGAPV